jgi:hypothetical protein
MANGLSSRELRRQDQFAICNYQNHQSLLKPTTNTKGIWEKVVSKNKDQQKNQKHL